MGGGISNANQRENAQDDDVNEKRQWRLDERKRKFITSTVNSSNKGYTEGISDPLVARGTPDPVESTTSRSKLTLAKGNSENPSSGAAASSILVKGAGNSSSTNTMRNMRNAFVAIVGDGASETVESEKSNLEGEPGATTSQGSVMNVAGPFICQSYNNAVEKTKGLGRAPAPGFFRSVVGPSPVVSNLTRKKVTSFLRPCVATGSEEKTSRDVAFDPPAMPFVTPSTGGGSARGPLRMRLRIKQGNEGRPVARADTPEKGLLQKSGAKNKTVPPSAPYNLDFEW
ncbi:hypothetical protein TCSYLVIO_010602 [Trypanosoma cruzi]|nr:hypothetical protein TCSYLVIO_010602 [Trypanosoma cruzi]